MLENFNCEALVFGALTADFITMRTHFCMIIPNCHMLLHNSVSANCYTAELHPDEAAGTCSHRLVFVVVSRQMPPSVTAAFNTGEDGANRP